MLKATPAALLIASASAGGAVMVDGNGTDLGVDADSETSASTEGSAEGSTALRMPPPMPTAP